MAEMEETVRALRNNGAAKWRRGVSAAVIGAVALVALGASSEEETATKVSKSGEAAAADAGAGGEAGGAPSEFAIGDVVALGDFEVIVHSAAPYTSTNEFLEPDPGNIWIAVDVEVKNNSASAETVSSLAQFEVQDAESRSYNVELMVGDNLPMIDGEAPSGGSRRGTVVFEVPETATGLKLNFTGGFFSSGTASIRLMP